MQLYQHTPNRYVIISAFSWNGTSNSVVEIVEMQFTFQKYLG